MGRPCGWCLVETLVHARPRERGYRAPHTMCTPTGGGVGNGARRAGAMGRQGVPALAAFQHSGEQGLLLLYHVRELREHSRSDLGREFEAIPCEN